MKKTIALVTIAAVMIMAAVTLVNAAPPEGTPPGSPPGGPPGQVQKLTDDQKKELAPLYDKMLGVQKEIMQKYVSYGYLTQEQADQRAAWMKERMNSRLENGYGPGMMRGPGGPGGHGPGFGPGAGGRGPCWQQQQQPAANQ